MTFNSDDLQQIARRGGNLSVVEEQLDTFQRGLPYLTLDRPCTIGDGIVALDEQAITRYDEIYDQAAKKGRALKFVPASGAASRMFQNLLSAAERGEGLDDAEIKAAAESGDLDFKAALQLVENLDRFAFGDALRRMLSKGGVKEVLRGCLASEGLHYAQCPKALIPFHRYADHARTPLEEHLVEGAAYALDAERVARLHFTVSPEHEESIRRHIANVLPRYQAGVTYELGFSTQHPSTDTIAVDDNNEPFRDDDGRLVFRPGGHGALLENLNELDGDIIFIKNIDNVVPDALKAETTRYKKALGGLLVSLQDTLFAHLRKLESSLSSQGLQSGVDFLERELGLIVPKDIQQSPEHLRSYLVDQMNRPLRVCGVVRNTGEPGGGPFWVRSAEESVSRQIVESSQVDTKHEQQKTCWLNATHFNPVDLVCGVRDYRGQPFELHRFVDRSTGFISRKSKGGRTLKALELPGLWNGAMAHWNTVFVEVPAITFNPVKTVFDLLRPEHQT